MMDKEIETPSDEPEDSDAQSTVQPNRTWRLEKSLEQLAAEQGVDLNNQWSNFSGHVGMGKDCWDSVEEFEQWLADIYAVRKTNNGKPYKNPLTDLDE